MSTSHSSFFHLFYCDPFISHNVFTDQEEELPARVSVFLDFEYSDDRTLPVTSCYHCTPAAVIDAVVTAEILVLFYRTQCFTVLDQLKKNIC